MNFCLLLCLVVTTIKYGVCIDPVSISVVATGLGYLGYSYDFVKQQTYCRIQECCNEHYIPADTRNLSITLKENLFGQHIVKQVLIPALEAHFSPSTKPRKALVISFHGTTGTGKTYVSDFIAKSIYKNGLESKYVHNYLGRKDFKNKKETDLYNERITKEIQEALADCPRSLFIFEEVDRMPPGVFESLAAIANYNTHVKGVDYSKAIFILISNTAGVEISDKLADLIVSGKFRKETKLSDFEKILEKVAYNHAGGMQKTSLVEAKLIDFYIPFLPLERVHVKKCLEAEFKRWNLAIDQELINEILNNPKYYENRNGLFAKYGCKRVMMMIGANI